jgi:hypothetical protein
VAACGTGVDLAPCACSVVVAEAAVTTNSATQSRRE